MEKNTKIEKVSNNIDKGKTYNDLFKKYNNAYKNEFYFECMIILYNIIEDRTSAILYNIGFTSKKDWHKVAGKKYKNDIKEILKIDESKNNYGFKNLSNKLDNILKLLEWSFENHAIYSNYQKEIKKFFSNKVDYDEIKNAIIYLQHEWRDIRNQLTHALCNKNISSVDQFLKPMIDKGIIEIRKIDKLSTKVRNHEFRKKFNIQ